MSAHLSFVTPAPHIPSARAVGGGRRAGGARRTAHGGRRTAGDPAGALRPLSAPRGINRRAQSVFCVGGADRPTEMNVPC